ncbi:MAG TPA: YHS domain-containing (seleno)protein [Aliidongia sp.]|uniref:YHS domain-containing (seleno)protein n=1 Tax=Aliidongia sp. TaxID=1914230 RepID=UPI002DDCDBAE|nr:YHS domain-containing (seleno)protein [Aliidongia sp.]HEV2678734.1 YHS domain-containing (seleno)protein [Aliidongia sp.]
MVAVLPPLPSARPFPTRLVAFLAGLLLAGVCVLVLEAATPADPPVSFVAHTGVINMSEGLALKGYDPVAYFTDGRAVPGDPGLSTSFDGAVWRFESLAHRRAFLAHPSRYEPEYGGFCAYGLALGRKTDIDPTAFSIIGGRLYLNADQDTRVMWRQNLLDAIAEADRNWPTVKDRPVVVR